MLLLCLSGSLWAGGNQPSFKVSTSKRSVGKKYYELTGHKGNVGAVATDKKMAAASGANVTGFDLDMVSWGENYSYGSQAPGRNVTTAAYRYGFNGMEKDDEVNGEGASYTTEFRFYEPKVGRWMSIDPVFHAHLSAYNAFDANPVFWSDPSGADSETDPPGGGGDKKKAAQPTASYSYGASDAYQHIDARAEAVANAPAATTSDAKAVDPSPLCNCTSLSSTTMASDAYATNMQTMQTDIDQGFYHDARNKWLDSPSDNAPWVTNRMAINQRYEILKAREEQVSATPRGYKPTMLYGKPISSYTENDLQNIAFTRSRDGAAFAFVSEVVLFAAPEIAIVKYVAPVLRGGSPVIRAVGEGATGCFVEDTEVSSGTSSKAIQTLNAGDLILVMPAGDAAAEAGTVEESANKPGSDKVPARLPTLPEKATPAVPMHEITHSSSPQNSSN